MSIDTTLTGGANAGLGAMTNVNSAYGPTANFNPYGFTAPTGAATQAIVPWRNTATGQTWTAMSGGWTPPSSDWVIGGTSADDLASMPGAGTGTTDTTLTGGAGAGAGDAGAGAGAGDAGAGAGAGAGTLDPSQSTLSANFAPYIYDMLLKGQMAANLPFQAFTGQRFAFGTQDPETGQYSAGYSPLESRGLGLLKDLGQYGPDAFKGGLGEIGNIASFMSPYQQGVIDIEKRKAQEAGDIAKRNLASKFLTPGGAGAFGGSRYAIESGMLERDLQQNLADIQTRGLQAAYDRATKERQYATEQGMKGLEAVLEGGQRERAIAQSPLDFGYQQWLESVRRPAEQAKEMQGLLAGLPLQAPEYQPEQSAIAAALQGIIGALGLGKLIG